MTCLLLAVVPTVACAPQVALVPSRAADVDFHTITVVGEGKASAKPDVARAVLGIDVTAPTVAEASRRAAERMNHIMAALKQAGIPDQDIRTSNFSVSREMSELPPAMDPMHAPAVPAPAPATPPSTGGKKPLKGAVATPPEPPPLPAAPPSPPPAPPPGMMAFPAPPPPPYPYPPPGYPRYEAYRVSNMVEVKVRDLAKVGPTLDAVLAAGANQVYGVTFEIDDPNPVEAKAREQAAADAKSKAAALAKLQGVTLGGVASISEIIGEGGPPYPMPRMATVGVGDFGTPVSPGEITLRTQVRVVYVLEGAASANDDDEE